MTEAQKRKLAAKAKLWMALHGAEKNGHTTFEDDVWCADCRYRKGTNCKKIDTARWWYLYNSETEEEKIVKKPQHSFSANASCVERFL